VGVTGSIGEFGRIRRWFAPLTEGAPGALDLTDDAALLGGDQVVTVDAIVEGVHFRAGDPPELVARKLLRVNLSDVAAMGARPEHWLLAMALPSHCDDAWVERFAAGLAADQAEYGIRLLGGDSTATPGPITLAVTMIGRLGVAGAVKRAGARPGDLVFVTGTIGDAALGLVAAGRALDLGFAARQFLEERYLLPRPRVSVGWRLAGLAHAMLDVSDGLVGDLEHMAEVSGVAAEIDAAAIPLSDAAAEALAEAPGLIETVLTGGDDYELLFAAPSEAAPALRAIAAETGVPITPIGRIREGKGVRALDRDGGVLDFATTGYRHV
jgi:thiamine-monophosphate kinase